MITEFKIPELGENIESGNVVRVLVSVGQSIEKDQGVLELETDKATIEVPSPVGGVVREIRVAEGAKAKVGDVVLTIETQGGAPAEPAKPAAKPQAAAAPEPVAPKPAARVERPVAAEPAVALQPAPVVDRPVVMAALQVAPASTEPRHAAPAAPSVRRFAREIGIDINSVGGTGPGGRISVQDIKDYSRSLHLEAAQPVPGIVLPGGALPDFAKWGAIERQPMNNIRVKTAQHLSLAWNTIPQVTQFDKADITELDNQRKHFGEKVAAAGGKLTVTAIL